MNCLLKLIYKFLNGVVLVNNWGSCQQLGFLCQNSIDVIVCAKLLKENEAKVEFPEGGELWCATNGDSKLADGRLADLQTADLQIADSQTCMTKLTANSVLLLLIPQCATDSLAHDITVGNIQSRLGMCCQLRHYTS